MNQFKNPTLYWAIAFWLILGVILAECCITIALSAHLLPLLGMFIGRCCVGFYGLTLAIEYWPRSERM
jgi:hypothetical protein